MATFEATQSQFSQEHFEVLEIDLPVIDGVCTIGGSLGFGTPLSCDQQTYTTKTYKFTNANAPLLPESEIYRCIKSISEAVTELKPSEGLSSRGTLSIQFNDFIGDPNQDTAGVTDAVKSTGTFFGKLSARQIFANKEVRIKLYRVQADGSIDLVSGAQTRYYSAEAFTNSGKGGWSLKCKDELSVANLDDKTWLSDRTTLLRTDMTNVQTTVPVFAGGSYAIGDILLIGDEFVKVTNINSATELAIAARGLNIVAPVSGVILTKTEVDDHSAGDEIFKCRMSDNETIDSLLTEVLTDSDVPSARIPVPPSIYAWSTEVGIWQTTNKINTLWYKAEEVNSILKRVLTAYLMNMWFDPVSRFIRLSAISVWKESSKDLIEGNEINSESIKIAAKDDIRATRALAIYDKKYLAKSDDVENYARGSQFSEQSLITDVYFGKHKDKLFDPSVLLTKNSADLLVQRYVSSFKFTPKIYTWVTPERKLNFNTGDIVDIKSGETQSMSGEKSSNERAQVLSINPKYTTHGRTYNIKAMTYTPAFSDNEIITLTGNIDDYNLFGRAGNPASAVTITFILDNITVSSTNSNTPAISAGGFVAGSKIIIILRNGVDWQSKGGDGGEGGSYLVNDPGAGSNGYDGANGGICYDAGGIDTDIYLSGTDPEGGTASGFLRAPGGGAGGAGGGANYGPGGGGGGGGAGINVGFGGAGGLSGFFAAPNGDGEAGANGDILGNGGAGGDGADTNSGGDGGDFGQAGTSGDPYDIYIGGLGGAAGKGIVKSGAVVNVYGDTPTNFINGGGDTPDA